MTNPRLPSIAAIQRSQAAYKQWAELALRARAAGWLDLVEQHQPPRGASATAIRQATRDLRLALGEISRSKYGNRHVEAYGHTFDSAAELRRFEQLRLLQLSGAIGDVRVHPRYVIIEALQVEGITEPAIQYEADFEYCQDGKTVVEDVKGVWTEAFKLKRRLFLARYAGVYEYRLVDARCV